MNEIACHRIARSKFCVRHADSGVYTLASQALRAVSNVRESAMATRGPCEAQDEIGEHSACAAEAISDGLRAWVRGPERV